MGRIRLSTLGLAFLLAMLLLVLLAQREALMAAHVDESISYFSSDAATYYAAYVELFAHVNAAEHPVLFLVGSPILFMKLADGNLFVIQLAQLLLMAVTLRTACRCFSHWQAQAAFAAGAVAMPYFLFGFLSLNKEIYAMCSGIFFASYLMRGRVSHLLAALLLAALARYYMVASLLALWFCVPRTGPVRWGWIVAMLLAISVIAPFSKELVPQYSSEDLLDAPSTVSTLFARLIDNYGYAVAYPFKYLVLIPMRAYSFLIDPTRLGNAMEAVVSVVSLAALLPALHLLLPGRRLSPVTRRLIIAALVAPIPMMWSEIMHWRYYTFVYFFLLAALVRHHIDEPARAAARAPTLRPADA